MEPTSLIANANKVATPTSPEMGKIKSPEEELAFLRSQLDAKKKEIEEIKSKSILLPGATEVSVINAVENLPVNETGTNKNAEVGSIISNEIANKEIAPKETAIVEMTPAPASTIETAPSVTAHEVIKDYANTPHEEVLHKDFALAPEKVEEIVLDLAPEEHDGKIAEILGIMQVHGIRNALEVVNKMNDPHVQDDFERFLVQYAKAGFPLKGLAEKEPEFKALHMTLYEITLPEKTDEGKERALKELLSSMEQFYAGMMSVDADGGGGSGSGSGSGSSGSAGGGKGTGYFTIELAVSNNGDDFSFHVAVHDNKKSLFEKQILSIFHNAKIIEKKNDYNIFNEGGAVSASYVMASKDSVWPLKTYEQFDHDPLNVILNSFSKIKTNGEGASIQIVIKPQSSTHISRYKKILEDVKKGVKPSEAIAKNASGMLKHVEGFFKKAVGLTYSEEEKKKQEEKKKEEATHIDQVAIEQIQAKMASPVVSINIRLIASAENQAVSDQILADIESAFNQFENTNGNKIVCERAESKGGLGSIVSSIGAGSASLKSLLYNYSFRIFDEKRSILTNLKELTTLIHFPVTGLKSAPHLKTAKAGTAPAPMDLPKEGSGVLLGVNRDRAKETRIFMTPEDRLRHLYVIGQTGTGKTTMLKNMIAQDIANGEGVCMIDPHGSDIQDILALIPKHRYEDVIYFDPSDTARPLALNMLEYDQRFPEQKTFVVNEMLSIFNKLFDMKVAGGPMFEQYFRNSVLLAMEDPDSGNTLLDVSRILANKTFRELKISKCKNPIVVQFWKEVAEKAGGEASLANIVPYITSKFDVFLSNDIMRPIIAQEKSSLNFREIMDTKKILLVNLSKGRLGDINANLIGLILVGKILMAALSRVDQIGAPAGAAGSGIGGGMASLPPFYLYIDEFQNVTTNSISTILSEARKYKLSLAVAHQFIAQLEEGIRDSVFGNVGSIATFRVGAEDAEYLEKQFSPVFTAKDLMSVDNRNAYIKMLANGRPVKPFNIETMAPPAPIGNANSVQAVKELSKLKYGRDRAEVEEEIMKKYKK